MPNTFVAQEILPAAQKFLERAKVDYVGRQIEYSEGSQQQYSGIHVNGGHTGADMRSENAGVDENDHSEQIADRRSGQYM